MTEQEQLAQAFRVELEDCVARMRTLVAECETAVAAEAVRELTRLAGNLVGAARIAGAPAVATEAGQLEKLFADLPDAADRLAAVHEVAARIEALERRDPEPEPEPAPRDDLHTKLLAAFRVEQQEHLEAIRALLAPAADGATLPEEDIQEIFRRAHSLKGAARACDLTATSDIAHGLEDLYAKVRDEGLALDAGALRVVHRALDAIEDGDAAPQTSAAIDKLLGREVEVVSAPAPKSEPASQPAAATRDVETVRVTAERFDRILDAAGQVLTECMERDVMGRDLKALHGQTEELQRAFEWMRRALGARIRQADRDPELARVSQTLDDAASRVRLLARSTRDATRRQVRNAWTLTQLGHRLQGEVRRARMTPAENAFQGFRKMVRDIAREEGKKIDFSLTGLQVRADRMVLQALKDPLMHMVRNAISHGVETPEERRAQGKPECARIDMRIRVSGNRLQISVEDDGRGIDRARVAQEAVRRGQISEAQAAALSDEGLTELLCRAGFSTTRAVTKLSGRGMGLSVVHETAARLQGHVALRPTEIGTHLAVEVPLAVSTYRMLLVECGGRTYALPLSGVERLVRVRASELHEAEGRAMIRHRGELVPAVDLAAVLDIPCAPRDDEILTLIVMHAGSRRGAVAVERILGEREALLKNLDAATRSLRHLAGAILLEDGEVALVLQPSELVASLGAAGATSAAIRSAVPAEIARQRRILVVDDSFTTRTLETSILETHGYDVVVAVDGREALEKLNVHDVDLVITDVEMPRLDGFGLLRELKADNTLQATPVIMVSSRDQREDRLRGLELGADAYIVKQRFDHEELLDTIQRILG